MYSSTTLEGPSKSGCWKMLDFSEQRADSLFPLEYRSYLGQAGHAVLQYCAERRCETEAQYRKTGEEVGSLLIREGRTFRGHQEPPLPPDDVWQGVDIAIAYLMARGLPLDAEVLIPEQEWVHPTLPYTALIDLVSQHEDGDEEYGVNVRLVRDWKSSWQAGPDELDTLQRWGQVVCVWRNLPEDHDVGILRQSVVNLRTWSEYTRDIHLDDPDAEYTVADLERWEKRIESLCMVADMGGQMDGGRPANPGVGCLSCAYRHICDDATHLDQGEAWTPESAAHDLAIVEAQRSLILTALKASDVEMPIQVAGGWVGYKQESRRVFRPGTEKHLLGDWFERMAAEMPAELQPVLTSLIAALKLGKSNLDAFAKALYPERKKGIGQVRDEYVQGLTDEKRESKFGVWSDE